MPISLNISDVSAVTATEAQALRAMFDLLTNAGVAVQVPLSPVGQFATDDTGALQRVPVNLTRHQVEAMDDTAGLLPSATSGFTAPFVPPAAVAGPPATAPAAPQVSSPPTPPVPSPPVPNAPLASAPPARVVPATLASVDSRGLPWDERIHSGEPVLTEKGVWRKRRGLKDAAYIATVEAELLQRAVPLTPDATPTSVGSVAVPAVPSPPVLAVNVTGEAIIPAPPSSSQGVPPVPPPVPGAVPPPPNTGFAALASRIARATAAGKLAMADVPNTLAVLGYGAFPTIASNTDAVAAVSHRLEEIIKHNGGLE